MNEEQQQEILQALLKGFSEQVRKAADEAISEAECRILPYVLSDTDCNAMFQAQDIVRAILEGRFEYDGEILTFNHPRAPSSLRMKITDFEYDHLRDQLIERMPSCPKDAKIAALKADLKNAYENRR